MEIKAWGKNVRPKIKGSEKVLSFIRKMADIWKIRIEEKGGRSRREMGEGGEGRKERGGREEKEGGVKWRE